VAYFALYCLLLFYFWINKYLFQLRDYLVRGKKEARAVVTAVAEEAAATVKQAVENGGKEKGKAADPAVVKGGSVETADKTAQQKLAK
jgi:hypothetical protein